MSSTSVSYLTTLIEHQGIELPACREQIEELTPWAVADRYDDSFEAVLDMAENCWARFVVGRNI